MRNKHPIHTTISKESLKILERYEKELGAKNVVLELALSLLSKFTKAHGIESSDIEEFINKYSVTSEHNLGINIKGVEAFIRIISYDIFKNGSFAGKIVLSTDDKTMNVSYELSRKIENEVIYEIISQITPGVSHVMPAPRLKD